MKKIVIACATKNNNLKLSTEIEKCLKEKGAEVELIELEGIDLPLYTPAAESKGIPSSLAPLKKSFENATGLIFVAPEYNGSIPPVTINAVNWLSRSGDENWRACFDQKFAVVATHSGGGGAKVCHAMRGQLEHLGCVVLSRAIVTNYQKQLNPDSLNAIMDQLLKYS